MTKKQRVILIIFGIAIIVVLSLIIFLEMQSRKLNQPDNKINPPQPVEGNVYVPDEAATTRPRDWEETEFRQPVPVDVKVPEVGEVLPDNLKDIVAVPEHSVDIPVSGGANFRIFRIRGEGDKFSPEQVIVNFKDMVHIELMAIDKDYDVVLAGYNMMVSAKKGETKAIEFQALQDGRFMYYCNSCGGPESTAKGEIIVVK